ncbi:uncharacterized protein DUF4105 [Vibrio sp. ES.051]|uniref:Lnb N-terminal periplasmic domain-containing protein n=1 Tax=Vibrio sp. ES.051 TaxID=1761909 RepID=UPI000BF4D90C|nr:DUF4105 domain-containing protein [Vibrio sp. ES.051]PFG45773.1 uncharacterized protein DUF4105 [Vibrio sp. ES.051]
MKLSFCTRFLLISSSVLLPSLSVQANSLDFQQLAQTSYWLKLGHYLPATLSHYKSTVDSPDFFLSDEGKTNPKAELVASFNAFYHADEATQAEMRCHYPARFTWLEKQQGRSAVLNCPKMEDWKAVLNPAGMTLVFPTAFMNNPSSMFGHTLLRVDAKDQTRHKELVAFAVNFAAEPQTDDNAALYALKGLTGSYPGRFTVMPYYRKVREYNDIESRDIWEYKLNLSEDEVNRVLLHLWEMQKAEFDYYFIDENCSYQLLALLELTRDDLSLVDDFPGHAIPSDTVETLANNGLLDEPKYRAAFGTRLLHQLNEIDEKLFEAAIKAKQGEYPSETKFTAEERAAILEFAYEWLNYELYDEGLERDPTARQLTQLLYQRSRIKTDSPFSPVLAPKVSPEKGHASARAGLTYQYNDITSNRVNFQWRAAYHDLLDSQAGFIPGAKISFLDTAFSIDQNANSRLEKLHMLDAMALAPGNKVFDSLAWNIRSGFDRMPDKNKLAGRWFAQGGAGKAWGQSDKLHLYTLISGEISGGELTNYDLTLGAGVETGILWQASINHRIGIQGQYLHLLDSHTDQNAKVTASWNWTLSRNWAIRGELEYQHWSRENTSASLTGYFYY